MPLDPTIPLGVKPVDFLGTASNLLNMARGAQSFQQEQQMMPLQLEQARINIGKSGLDLDTLRKTQEENIERLKAESRTAVTLSDRNRIALEIEQATKDSDVLRRLAESRSAESQATTAGVQARVATGTELANIARGLAESQSAQNLATTSGVQARVATGTELADIAKGLAASGTARAQERTAGVSANIAEQTQASAIARALAESGLAVTNENIARVSLQLAQGSLPSDLAKRLAEAQFAVTTAQTGQQNLAAQTEGLLRSTLNPLNRPDWIANAMQNPENAIRDIRLRKERAVAAGVPADQAEAFAASAYSVLADARKANDPSILQKWMFDNMLGQQTPARQQELLAPSGTPNINLNSVPGFGVSTPSGPSFRPLGLEQGGAPAAQPRPSMGQPPGVTPSAMQMPPMQYPVRRQGAAAILAPGEAVDFTAGQQYRNKLVDMQPPMATFKRDVQEVVSKADEIAKKLKAPSFQSGYIGAIERNVRENIMGDSDYQQLSKDLARLTLSTMAAQGSALNTDAGKQLAAQANGTVTYAPEVIMSQARKTYAGILATEAEGQAADLFLQRYGEANHNVFKQLWSKNSNNRVFELMGLQDLVPDPAEQKRITKEVILKGMTPKQIDELTKQYRNIKRLRETGSL
jgi:hypothetical protein